MTPTPMATTQPRPARPGRPDRNVRRRRLGPVGLVLVLALAALAAACGDDEEITEPETLDPEDVAGTYDPTLLTFDVSGSLPAKDILDGLGEGIPPRLVVSLNHTFQVVFIDPVTGEFQSREGEYTLLEDGVRLEFRSASDAMSLLLPQNLELTQGDGGATLGFSGEIDVSRARLRELVPEFEEEPLADPVPGTLDIVFTLDESPAAALVP